MQPYFFPYIGYFQLINAVDTFVVYDNVNFIKQGWIARNKILLNGSEHMISLQLQGASSFKKINEIAVGRNRSKLIKTIQQAYSKAPYYQMAFPVIENILTNPENNLGSFLSHQIKELCAYLGINAELILSSSIEKDNSLKGQEKVLQICKKLHATHYVNAAGGKELYSKDDFLQSGISLNFIKSIPFEYKQFGAEHLPWLSIIDVMMFNSVAKIQECLNNYIME